MNKIFFFLLAFLTSMTIYGQDITGSWNGILNVQGTQLRLVFNIKKTGDNYSSTMDSPDQGAKGIPVNKTSFENNIIKLEVTNAGIEYEGKLNQQNNFEGTFKQGGLSIDLNLTRDKIEKKTLIRPQEPKKPYPYYSEEIVFENKKDSIMLAGTLTMPAKEGYFPAVVLITGSGPQNRDEEIEGHKPFLVLADHLTKNGIAVLRFDDRGTAESKGNFKTATTPDFARDVEYGVKYLQTRKEINKNKIGLIGHSEGGIIAPMVAAKSKDIFFIVLLAGTGIRGAELLQLQKELIEKADSVSEEEIQKDNEINKGAFDIICSSTDKGKLKEELMNYLKQKLKEFPDSKPSQLSDEDFLKTEINQLTSPWMLYFIKYDPSIILKDVKCPVLALNGSKDLQVPPKINLEAIKNNLEKNGNKNVTVKELPNLNHLFQECETGSPDEYSKIEQTFSPSALKEISDWISVIVK